MATTMRDMPARPTLPADDLYVRLGVPHDASAEAIEVAWRGLLRKHHPDIAGPDALELAKRINIAHDWLSDPELRRRYDRERGTRIRSGQKPRAAVDRCGSAPPRTSPRRPPTTEERVAAVIERIGRLTRTTWTAWPVPSRRRSRFLATLRRFVDVELQATLDDAERAALDALPRAARTDPAIHDAIAGRLADIVLGDVLEELLGDPAGARAWSA